MVAFLKGSTTPSDSWTHRNQTPNIPTYISKSMTAQQRYVGYAASEGNHLRWSISHKVRVSTSCSPWQKHISCEESASAFRVSWYFKLLLRTQLLALPTTLKMINLVFIQQEEKSLHLHSFFHADDIPMLDWIREKHKHALLSHGIEEILFSLLNYRPTCTSKIRQAFCSLLFHMHSLFFYPFVLSFGDSNVFLLYWLLWHETQH